MIVNNTEVLGCAANAARAGRQGTRPQSQPRSSATRTASARFRASSFCITDDRWLRTVPGDRYRALGEFRDCGVPARGGEDLVLAWGQRTLALAERGRCQARVDDSLAGDAPA